MRIGKMLFPVLRWTRLRREVGGLRAALPMMVAALAAMMVGHGPLYASFIRRYVSGGSGSATPTWGAATVAYVQVYWIGIIGAGLVGVLLVLAAAAIESFVALIFVRTRPGRRRPLCTWQTIKFVLFGTWSWIWLFALWFVIVLTNGIWWKYLPQSEALSLMLGILTFACPPVLLLGAIAAQAANAVVALQDDRRCTVCGYFLIGLQSTRCPECGTPFDRAKLKHLAAAAADTDAGTLEQTAVTFEQTAPEPERLGIRRRCLEWIFPIRKYVRQRREVGFARAILVALLMVLLLEVTPGAVEIGEDCLKHLRWAHPSTPAWEVVTRKIWDLSPRFWRTAAVVGSALVGVGAALILVNLLLAWRLVRKRPGRRRPRCAWQTLKFVLLGSRGWILGGYGAVAIWIGLGKLYEATKPDLSSHARAMLATLIYYGGFLAALMLTAAMFAWTASHAAEAVVALQDDRACKHCGYFLIGLRSTRCPECGTEFDPATLGSIGSARAAADGEAGPNGAGEEKS